MKTFLLTALAAGGLVVGVRAQTVIVTDSSAYLYSSPVIYQAAAVYLAPVVYQAPVIYQGPVVYQSYAPRVTYCEPAPKSTVLIIHAQGGVSRVDYGNKYSTPCGYNGGSQVIYFGGGQARAQGYSFSHRR